jgi:cytoskeletal protein CcmA (bactofilin family)
MPRRSDIISNDIDTVIGAGVRVRGVLSSDGDISIDGHMTGEIKAAGSVSLGVNSIIKANVTARDVRVGGQLRGDITATGETSITETGKVVGNISCSSLQITPGAVFIGQSTMTETEVTELPDEDEPDLDHQS